MDNIVIYVHGKGGSAEEAEHYKPFFLDSEVIGFDYCSQTPWEAKEEFFTFFAEKSEQFKHITLISNSIGAYFRYPHWIKRWLTMLFSSLRSWIWKT